MRGPRTVPWGTPESTLTHSEHSPSTTTLCRLFVRKASIQFNPGMRVASDPIPPQLPHQSLVRHFVEGFGEV